MEAQTRGFEPLCARVEQPREGRARIEMNHENDVRVAPLLSGEGLRSRSTQESGVRGCRSGSAVRAPLRVRADPAHRIVPLLLSPQSGMQSGHPATPPWTPQQPPHAPRQISRVCLKLGTCHRYEHQRCYHVHSCIQCTRPVGAVGPSRRWKSPCETTKNK